MAYYGSCMDSHQPHFLEACFLCRKPLSCNSDIFMYRGNTPFCSMECRQEQIEIDESLEKKKKSWKYSTSSSAAASSSSSPSSASSSRSIRKTTDQDTSPNKAVRTGTVAVA